MPIAHAVMLESPVGAADHALGPATAPVTLVEYGDFECHYCGRAYPVVKELAGRFGDSLRVVFRHSPRSHANPHAEHAAEAAEAAAAQGKFWEMHDRLFEHQTALGDEDLAAHAAALGLDTARFNADFREHAFASHVHAQAATGAHSVLATPTFFVNGVRFDDTPDLPTLASAIERAARAPGTESGAPKNEPG
jgi:protein-disulfide isomerase